MFDPKTLNRGDRGMYLPYYNHPHHKISLPLELAEAMLQSLNIFLCNKDWVCLEDDTVRQNPIVLCLHDFKYNLVEFII